MNISMLDMYSLAWKINLVEKGVADASILLPTYEHERKGIAEELLKFDKAYSTLFSGRSPKSEQLTDDAEKAKGKGAVDAQLFIETFKKNAFCMSTSSISLLREPIFTIQLSLRNSHFGLWSDLFSKRSQRTSRF